MTGNPHLAMMSGVLETDMRSTVHSQGRVRCPSRCNTRSYLDETVGKDLYHDQTEPTVISEDNQAAIAIAQKPHSHSKMKHIDIRYFVQEKVQDNTIDLRYCPTNNILDDILMKGLMISSHNSVNYLE